MRLVNLVICSILIVVCFNDALAARAAAANKNNNNRINKIGSRIVGGKKTTINTAKYLLYLRRDGKFTCGCTLVAPRKVVTAAHCVQGVSPSRLTVHGGTTYLRTEGVKRAVIKIAVSPQFNKNSLTSDVAVLTLARDMTGPNIAPISLCTSAPRPGSTVRVSGWGLTNERRQQVSNQLQTVYLKMIKKSRCQQNYRNKVRLTNTMMCATVPGAKRDSCSGDSGGPLVQNGRLCGIVSFGIGCARSGFPGVYTSIMQVKPFINRHLTN